MICRNWRFLAMLDHYLEHCILFYTYFHVNSQCLCAIHPYQSLSTLIGQSDALAASGKQSLTSSRSSLVRRLAILRTTLFPASLISDLLALLSFSPWRVGIGRSRPAFVGVATDSYLPPTTRVFTPEFQHTFLHTVYGRNSPWRTRSLYPRHPEENPTGYRGSTTARACHPATRPFSPVTISPRPVWRITMPLFPAEQVGRGAIEAPGGERR